MLEATARRQRKFLKVAFFCISGALCLPLLLAGLVKSYRAARLDRDSSQALSYTVAKPAVDDLLGTWLPDQATVELLQSKGVKLSQHSSYPVIALGKGRYVMRDMPYWGLAQGPQQFTVSGEGRWSIHRERGAWVVYIYVGEVEVRGYVLGQKPRHLMKVVVGDEAVNQPLLFRRAEARD